MNTSEAGNNTLDELPQILQRQRDAFNKEGPVSYETRIDRIDRCIALMVDHQDALCEAVNADFGCRSRHVTRMSDIFTSLGSLKFARKNLKKWMQPERRRAPSPMNLFGARAHIHYQPKGVIGIMSPWNVPINVVFSPLSDVLSAGNRAMIKPSEFNPQTVALLKQLFAQYFDETEIAIISGDADIGSAFSALPLDHLIFTGGGEVGKLVMQAAAKNLTPVTLELGGKSPVVVSESCDILDAAEKIITAKAMNSGQLCINADYCFVPEAKIEQFIQQCRKTVAQHYPSIMDNPDFVSVINGRNYDRIVSYLEDAESKGARVVPLNPSAEAWQDRDKHKIPLHLVIDPSDDMLVMQQELFGPILCLKPYRQFDDCIEDINNRPRALALYYFGKDKAEQQKLVSHTIAGGMSINDIGVHFACDDMPFGGIGPSGMGHYHGHDGFKTFSHAKAVFKQGVVNLPKLSGTLPPYGEKIDKMLGNMIKK